MKRLQHQGYSGFCVLMYMNVNVTCNYWNSKIREKRNFHYMYGLHYTKCTFPAATGKSFKCTLHQYHANTAIIRNKHRNYIVSRYMSYLGSK